MDLDIRRREFGAFIVRLRGEVMDIREEIRGLVDTGVLTRSEGLEMLRMRLVEIDDGFSDALCRLSDLQRRERR